MTPAEIRRLVRDEILESWPDRFKPCRVNIRRGPGGRLDMSIRSIRTICRRRILCEFAELPLDLGCRR